MRTTRDDEPDTSPYAGRWVARVQGRIVAHGGTPQAARRSAQVLRHKERPEITFVPLNGLPALPPLIQRVGQILADEPVFLVGGAVRDHLLGRSSHDFDFAVRSEAIAAARRVASSLQAEFYVLDQDFDAARVLVHADPGPPNVLDFSSFRGADLEADLAGRDFTMNAIALDLQDQTTWDPLNGVADLRAHTIRSCSANAFLDDPIRIVRAVRLAAALDFSIEPTTRRHMKEAADRLSQISPERQRDELFRILDGPKIDAALRALDILGVLPSLLPEMPGLKGVGQPPPHVLDVWEHTLSVIQNLESILAVLGQPVQEDSAGGMMSAVLSGRLGRYRPQIAAHLSRGLTPGRSSRSLLFLVALYHDVSKSTTRTVDDAGRIRFLGHETAGAAVVAHRCRALMLSNDEIHQAELLVANHMRFWNLANRVELEHVLPSRRAIFRFFRDTGEGGVDLVLLGLADLRGTRGHTLPDQAWSAYVDTARTLLENYWEKPGESIAPPRLVDGRDLMSALGIIEGPAVGSALAAIREAQAAGEIRTREDALALAREMLTKRDHPSDIS